MAIINPIQKPRIFLTGTGGQGTLTATRILAEAALLAGAYVVSGEIHGMAQRGGIVESCVLIGGWHAARIDLGEADILLGFEALETLRALPYLKKDGYIFTSTLEIPPISITLGEAVYPPLSEIKNSCEAKSSFSLFLPTEEIAKQIGNSKIANSVLLGALCASGLLPFGIATLEKAIQNHLPPKIQETNLKAIQAGADAFNRSNFS